MDNQQERFLGWLGGILDGEGTISIQKYTSKLTGNVRLTPFISIVNTNLDLLNECVRIIDSLVDKKHYIRLMSKKDSYCSRKQCFQIRVDGYKPVYDILSTIKYYLIGKRNQSETVLKFIELRKTSLIKRSHSGQIVRQGYTPKELALLSDIRVLNGRKSSETLCQTSKDEDKVRSSTKVLEMLRN